jgi:exodeoxyribonuclease VII large subunit
MEKLQQNPVFSVSDFIAVLNQTLEYAYPTVEIEGEVSSYKVNQSKFVFFDIKDATGSLNCFMTVWQVRTPIEDGMKVIVSAIPKVTQYGKFSLTVKSIRPSGVGAIKKSFEILKKKLDSEGLFSDDRKRQLPRLPNNIALISSTQAAGYADFIKIINDRWGGLKIEVAHVQVQGKDSPNQIIRALKYFNQQESLADVVVIIRGGGSAEDLAGFNDELLVREIAASRIPVLVGVGHETDESLSDLVADYSASTPSNAAQILVPDRNEIIRSVKYLVQSIFPRLDNSIAKKISEIQNNRLEMLEKIENSIEKFDIRIENLRNIVNQLNPNIILKRGYAIIRGFVEIGNIIEVETDKNIIKAEVRDVVNKQ